MKKFVRSKEETFLFDGKIEDHYWVVGNPKNPPLLLIHGFTGTHRNLLEMTEKLKEHFFVIVPDLPGWGASPRFAEHLTIHNYAKYLKELLDSIPIKKISIVGHCMGATLAIEFTYLYPEMVKKLILVSTPYLEGTMSSALFKHFSQWANHSPKKLRRLFYFWRFRGFGFPFAMVAMKYRTWHKKLKIEAEALADQSREHEDSVEEGWYSLVHYDYEKVKKITMPVHLLHGDEDILVSPEQAVKLQKLFPKATLDFLPHAGHVPPVETPQTLDSYIVKYL